MSRATYRADQVGSLLRPPDLLKARADFAEGKIGPSDLRYEEDRAILEILAVQRQTGIDILTDGELRRGGWLTDVAEGIEGFERRAVSPPWAGRAGSSEPSEEYVVCGKLRRRRPLALEQAKFLQRHAGAAFKVTLPAPSTFMPCFRPEISGPAYPAVQDMLRDLAGIVRDELSALAALGVPYLQLDAPRYARCAGPELRQMQAEGVAADRWLQLAVEADNSCLAGMRRPGLTLGLHVCGEAGGGLLAQAGAHRVAETLFGALDVDRFLLRCDTERCAFEPLRFVPADKTVVLGLIDAGRAELESAGLLRRRIEEAARQVPLDRLALSPGCGFAPIATGNPIDWDDQRRKLELVVRTARSVWG